MGRRPSKWMGYTTRLYPTFRGSARHMVSDDRRTLNRAYPTALGTNRWVSLLQTTRGIFLAAPIMQVTFLSNLPPMICTSQEERGPMGWQNLVPPNGSSPFQV